MSERTLVFLDAGVLADPVTRTLLMLSRPHSDFTAVWSVRAERQATGHLRPDAAPLATVRDAYGTETTPAGSFPDRFTATKPDDRASLADAEAAGARFLVTRDVHGFDLADLATARISAVGADLFLAERMSSASYVDALDLFSQTRARPRRTLERLHAAIAARYPQLFAVHAHLYDVDVVQRLPEPREQFRGLRCLRCERVTMRADDPHSGVCATCLHEAEAGSREALRAV
ncbi:MAG: hypothetical protein FWF90_01705 [Promicromonosporaceae bacterium]|nr:hypothetical protein [Promicromonosporaceae bacterium]